MVIVKVIKHASFMIIYLCIALFCIYCRDFGLHLDAHFLGIDINCHCLVDESCMGSPVSAFFHHIHATL